MATHQLQASRFELKYIIDERCARMIRHYARSYLVPDENADPRNNCEYFVHSLYLDSPDMALCRSTIHGLKNRFKLRVRFYNETHETPVFFEIKRRMNDVILKQRAAVKRASVPHLLAGRWPDRSDLKKNDDRSFGALKRFCDLQAMLRAKGKAFVSYIREAYVTANSNAVRLTFDREIRGGLYEGDFSLTGVKTWGRPTVGGVVLELKFTDRFPTWMRDMVAALNLYRLSMAKYVRCAQSLGTWRSVLLSPEEPEREVCFGRVY
jgi:hypothetical protein